MSDDIEYTIGGSPFIHKTSPAPREGKMSKEHLAMFRMDGLRKLCGYVENGTSQTVKLHQDDVSPYWWTVKAGNKSYHGASFELALDLAIADLPKG